MFSSRIIVGFFCVVVVVPFTAGCASSARTAETAEQQLRERADQLWSARVRQDWAAVYRFQDPPYRAEVPETEFVENNQKDGLFRFQSYHVDRVEVDGDLGWVEAEYASSLARFPAAPPRDVRAWSNWWRIDGIWYPCSPESSKHLPRAPSERSAEEERRLTERFREYWEVRRTGDHERVYAFLLPTDQAVVTPEGLAQAEESITYLSCDVRWVEVVGEQGLVRVEYLMKINDPSMTKLDPTKQTVTERWSKHQGQWYRDLKPRREE